MIRRITIPGLVLALFVASLPAAAQTENSPATGGQQQPVDEDEAGDPEIVPLRVGPVTISGSAWLDATFVDGPNEQGEDTFRVRRARLGLAGNLAPKIGWNISGELTSEPMLRNAFLVFRFTEQFNVRVGQAVPPTGLERGTSPLILELIDRSRLTNQLTYRQDVGLTVSNAEPLNGWVSYAVSVVNGAGLNRPDDNDAKDVALRLELTPPMVRGLTVNVSGGTGKQPNGRRTRHGAGVEYDRPAFKLMAEGLRQKQEGLPDSHGAVLIGAYRVRPATVTPHFRLLEFALRYVIFTDPAGAVPDVPDEDGADSSVSESAPRTTRELQMGSNYHVNRNVRVMANILVPVDSRQEPDVTFLTRLQIVF